MGFRLFSNASVEILEYEITLTDYWTASALMQASGSIAETRGWKLYVFHSHDININVTTKVYKSYFRQQLFKI